MSQISKRSSGGGGGNVTLVPDEGGPINAEVIPVEGITAYTGTPVKMLETVNDSGTLLIADNTFITPYVVDGSSTPGLQGTFLTIQEAMDAAKANGAVSGAAVTIIIRPGVYSEDIFIPDDSFFNFIVPAVPADIASGVGPAAYLFGTIRFSATPVSAYLFVQNLFITSPSLDGAILIPEQASVILKNCFVQGSTAPVKITGSSSLNYFYQCRFFGPFRDSSVDPAGQGATFDDCFFGDFASLSAAAVWNLTNCFIQGFNCDDTAHVNIFGCTKNSAGFCIVGTTTEQCSVFNSRFTIGDGTTSAIFDTQGPVIIGDLSFQFASETGPMSPLAGATTTIKLGPGIMGNILQSIQTATDYIALVYDQYIGVTSTSAARTVSLPSNPVPNSVFIVKDESLAAVINNITIDVDGGTGTIDGAATATINTNGGQITFKADVNGEDYFII